MRDRVLAAACLVFGTMAGAAWSQFRGPNGSGVAEESNPPVRIGPEQVAWQAEVPPGHSSPVLTDSLVVLTAVEDNRLVTLAFDARSGELAWKTPAPHAPLERVHASSNPAASTPCVDEQHIYVYFGSYGLLCYDHEGQLKWETPMETPQTLYGMSTSPILHENLVLLVVDDDRNLPDSQLSRSRIVAFEKDTGAVAWETARPFHRSGWSTPTVWRHDEGTELVVLGNGRLRGYDIKTGVEKWYVNGFSRETIARPVASRERVYAAASMIGGVADEQPDPEPFWRAVIQFDANDDGQLQRSEMTGHFTFPFRPDLPVDHPGFGMPLPKDPERRKQRLDGMFAGIDRDKNGSWSRDEFLRAISFDRGKPNLVAVRPGGQGDVTESHVDWALHRNIPEIPSPILHEGRIYLVRDGGILTSVDADTGKVLARERLDATGHYRSSPVIANGHLYLISQKGVVTVLETGDDIKVVHQFELGQYVAATPAFDADTIYIRTESKLIAYRRTQ